MTDTSTFPTELTEAEAGLASLDDMLDGLRAIAQGDDPEAEPAQPSSPPDGGGDAEPGTDNPDSAGGEPAGAVTPPSAAPATPPGYIDFEGQQYPVEQVRALLALDRRMRTEPEVAKRVGSALEAPKEPTPLPAWIDPEDQFQVNMWREQQATREAADKLVTEQRTQSESARRAYVVDSFRSAMDDFKSRYPALSEEQLRTVAHASAGVVDALERTEGSLTAAFGKGMEMALWADPSLRSTLLADGGGTVRADDKAKDRKVKLTALSGSGGSAPRTKEPAKPRTREEVAEAALAFVRGGMSEG